MRRGKGRERGGVYCPGFAFEIYGHLKHYMCSENTLYTRVSASTMAETIF